MRLTNTIRDAFIRAAMQDVPHTDYSEQIRKLAYEDLVSQLPEVIRKIWTGKKLDGYIRTTWNIYGGVTITYPAMQNTSNGNKPQLTQEVATQVAALEGLSKEQSKARRELASKLKSAAYGCTTRKQLAELLPEFEKYLPADEGKAIKANLPAVANLVAEFTKAGWPKNQPKPTPITKTKTTQTKVEGTSVIAL